MLSCRVCLETAALARAMGPWEAVAQASVTGMKESTIRQEMGRMRWAVALQELQTPVMGP